MMNPTVPGNIRMGKSGVHSQSSNGHKTIKQLRDSHLPTTTPLLNIPVNIRIYPPKYEGKRCAMGTAMPALLRPQDVPSHSQLFRKLWCPKCQIWAPTYYLDNTTTGSEASILPDMFSRMVERQGILLSDHLGLPLQHVPFRSILGKSPSRNDVLPQKISRPKRQISLWIIFFLKPPTPKPTHQS